MTQSTSGGGGGRGNGRGHGYGHYHHHSALCCLSGAPPLPGDAPPTPEPATAAAPAQAQGAAAVAVEGVLHKWTNYGRGWRERWFSLRDGVLSYSKIRAGGVAGARPPEEDGEVRLIGARISGTRRTDKPAGVVYLKEGKDENIEQEALTRNGFSSSRHGNFSEYSTTESDEFEKQDDCELTCEDEPTFFDSVDHFIGSENSSSAMLSGQAVVGTQKQDSNNMSPQFRRRTKLPEPTEKEKGISLWSIIKDSVGKDLTRVCLPVYFNEPLSSLQKCFEDLEYSYLLDQAYQYGKMGNSLMRILKVAAFAVSGYASSVARPCKPFNPLLGETYEADYPDRGVRFFAEKVSHHPMLIACHCEGKGWKFWGDSNLKSKFWGQSIQVDPVGILTVEFDDGETFQWSKVTTTIHNLILGKLYCSHHGTMHIKGNRQYSCKLKFKEPSLLDRNPHLVQGFVEDNVGNKASFLIGKWDESMYYSNLDTFRVKSANQLQGASLLWEKNKPAPDPTRYNLSSFAITLNELTPGLQEKLPPTDSRLRPDQRHLENGEYEKANVEKLRLEQRQRMSTKLQDNGWKPRWFEQDSGDGTYHYKGGYWETREAGGWDGCLDIFGEFSET
ncbi:hypothetical protein PR202_ga30693 [Eleusine coracana subsp. coracana]|uniref:PH domain-containing protein n=1 Tax=Eleusine coracana subsp. coracana TaxID=191504 RepID=A0AAV5DN77_ELECO|nr:hypothetical protein PR202_ga30693 [Eleusine coracana subsp. coracana]